MRNLSHQRRTKKCLRKGHKTTIGGPFVLLLTSVPVHLFECHWGQDRGIRPGHRRTHTGRLCLWVRCGSPAPALCPATTAPAPSHRPRRVRSGTAGQIFRRHELPSALASNDHRDPCACGVRSDGIQHPGDSRPKSLRTGHEHSWPGPASSTQPPGSRRTGRLAGGRPWAVLSGVRTVALDPSGRRTVNSLPPRRACP